MIIIHKNPQANSKKPLGSWVLFFVVSLHFSNSQRFLIPVADGTTITKINYHKKTTVYQNRKKNHMRLTKNPKIAIAQIKLPQKVHAVRSLISWFCFAFSFMSKHLLTPVGDSWSLSDAVTSANIAALTIMSTWRRSRRKRKHRRKDQKFSLFLLWRFLVKTEKFVCFSNRDACGCAALQ